MGTILKDIIISVEHVKGGTITHIKRALDYSLIDDIELDGIQGYDAPKFCDAYIASATYDGRDMTDAELDYINNDSDFVHECVSNRY